MEKNLKPILIEKVCNLAINTLKVSANTTCSIISHQAKVPKGIEKFKKNY